MDEINKVYNEDCLKGMRKIDDKSIDMILCDLPYGTTKGRWDIIIPFELLWEQYNRIIKDNGAMVLFASQPFTTDLINSNRKLFRYELIWSKNRGTGIFNAKKMPMKSHENIIVFYKKLPTYNPQMREGKPYKAKQGKQSKVFGLDTGKKIITNNKGERFPLSVLPFKSTNGKNMHPTQKPLELCEWLIKTHTNESETILDNCMGSGTTAIACINTNRKYIGFELDTNYYNLALKRIKEHQKE